MTYEEILDFARGLPNAVADKPFEGDFESTVLRHADTGKWFGILMRVSPRRLGLLGEEPTWILNLKCDPEEGFNLRDSFSGILPAYHMNKLHWLTVLPASDVPAELICDLIQSSYALTDKRRK